ncbi:hypothetical protein K432DRAFT_446587 [Lepidopterella palustris CBS 459.81]|uniref:GPI anchored serine-threonine rich protein n=1 Tax=Lepidopterella palustris CBS 459.81 TaxID=1314670 RepID=A0A8E2E1Q1_9PEZI|nr:hypothetical protein K432DRAFT_446587 [Lepidopterella palustris CBS 459.81]
MRTSISLILAFLACGSLAEEFFKLGPAGLFQRRTTCGHGATCQEACGGQAIPCGTSGYHCYDPSLGESCCAADEHYCPKGEFCAPVVGYCCLNSETPANCASRLSFSLPASSATSFSPSKSATVLSVSTTAYTLSTPSSSLKPSSALASSTSVVVAGASSTSPLSHASSSTSAAVVPFATSTPASSSQLVASTATKPLSASAASASSSLPSSSKPSSSTTPTSTSGVSTKAGAAATFTGSATKDNVPGAIFMGIVGLLAAL